MKKTLLIVTAILINNLLSANSEVIKKTKTTPNKINLTEGMVLVDGSVFKMGTNEETAESDEKPLHRVTVSSFYISKYEVTQSEYKKITGNNESSFKGDKKPVENVSFFDAIKFCNLKSKNQKLPVAYNEITGELLDAKGVVTSDLTKVKGYRLPTEAEWEFAAIGGKKSKGYKYAGGNIAENVAVYDKNSFDKGADSKDYGTHQVGTKSPNELDLYDMSGNVWEWCSDSYYSDVYNKSDNKKNPYFNSKNIKTFRVFRGSSWDSYITSLRPFSRGAGDPELGAFYIGFRLAKSQ